MDRRVWEAMVHVVTRVRHDSATKPPPWIKGEGVRATVQSQSGMLVPTNEQEARFCVSMKLSIYLLNCGVGEDS